MEHIFRQYTKDDLEELKHLMAELGYPADLSDLKNNIAAIQKNGGEIFIAESRSNVVGSICVLMDARLAEARLGSRVSA